MGQVAIEFKKLNGEAQLPNPIAGDCISQTSNRHTSWLSNLQYFGKRINALLCFKAYSERVKSPISSYLRNTFDLLIYIIQ